MIEKIFQHYYKKKFYYNSIYYEIEKTRDFISGDSFVILENNKKKYFWKKNPTIAELSFYKNLIRYVEDTVSVIEISNGSLLYEYVDFSDRLSEENFELIYDWLLKKNSVDICKIDESLLRGLKYERYDTIFSNLAQQIILEKGRKELLNNFEENRTKLISGIQRLNRMKLCLQHSDLHIDNILFSDALKKVHVIDWGFVSAGSGIIDLAMLLRDYGNYCFSDTNSMHLNIDAIKKDYAKYFKIEDFDSLYWTVDVCRSIRDINYFSKRNDLYQFIDYQLDHLSSNLI